MLRILVLLCLGGALTGCSPTHLATGPVTRNAYDGRTLPPEKTAIVEVVCLDGVSGEAGNPRFAKAWVIQPEISRESYLVFFPERGVACSELEEAKARATGLKWDSLAALGCSFEILDSNGQEYSPPLVATSPERPARLHVLPGEVEIKVRHYVTVICGSNIGGRWRSEPLQIRFIAEPGHTYGIRGKALITPMRWRLWVQNLMTGRTVAAFAESLDTKINIDIRK